MNPTKLGAALGLVLVAGAELTYLGLVLYLVIATFESRHLHQAVVNGAVVGTAAALAGIFGTAFATLLGLPVPTSERTRTATWLPDWLTLNNALGVGVILYMLAGALLGGTYVIREVESPGVVKAIAVAFGGYVIAYVGKAYSDWAGG